MWPIQLAFNFAVCRIFLSLLALCNTFSFLTRSAQLNENTEKLRAAQHGCSNSTVVPASEGKPKLWAGVQSSASEHCHPFPRYDPLCLTPLQSIKCACSQPAYGKAVLLTQTIVISSLFPSDLLFQRSSVVLYEVLTASVAMTRVFWGVTLYKIQIKELKPQISKTIKYVFLLKWVTSFYEKLPPPPSVFLPWRREQQVS